MTLEITEPHIDTNGNRHWLDEDGSLLCAPIFVDGTIDMENAGEPAWGQIDDWIEAECLRIQAKLLQERLRRQRPTFPPEADDEVLELGS